jgi:predicted  nucleic acid-binding Zn-ribbon protein
MKIILKVFYCIKCGSVFRIRTLGYRSSCIHCGYPTTVYQGQEEVETK